MGWLEEMTPGTTLTAEVREIIVTAMLAFSEHQRRVMIRAGVRFWPDQALPPEFDALVQRGQLSYTTSGATRYFRPLRLVHLFGTVNVKNVRHELAHCWDHVRRGSVRSLRGLSGDSLLAAIGRSEPVPLSGTDRVAQFLWFVPAAHSGTRSPPSPEARLSSANNNINPNRRVLQAGRLELPVARCHRVLRGVLLDFSRSE